MYTIEIDGTETVLTPEGPDGTFTLEQMQAAVGGYIQIIPELEMKEDGRYPTGRDIILDEEGKMKSKEINLVATAKFADSLMAGDVLVGTIMVAEDGEVS